VLYQFDDLHLPIDLELLGALALPVVVRQEQLALQVHDPIAQTQWLNTIKTLLHRFRVSVKINSISELQ
jgi:hypothetical protein